MILIISESLDYPTNDVINWLESYQKKFYVISYKDEIKVRFSDDLYDFQIIHKSNLISLRSIESVWFRRGFLKLSSQKLNNISLNLRFFHQKSISLISDFVNFSLFNHCETIGNPKRIFVNKLEVLFLAKKNKLLTPVSIISDNKDDVINAFKGKSIITKLLNPLTEKDENGIFNFLTFDCKKEDLEYSFTPSFFQEKIEKLFEVRTFYLKEKTYSKAIFSQNDDSTKVDYRNYNLKRPNREVPYILSIEIREKIILLMKSLDLDCGSIDFIVTKNRSIYFLEVNPIGQFSDLSYNCNYYLEKEIAKTFLGEKLQ